MKQPEEVPYLVVSDVQGRLLPHPTLRVAGRSGADIVEARAEEFIPLPPGSELFCLPSRLAIGFDPGTGALVPLEEGPDGEECWPAAAFLAPAHTATLLPAYAQPDPKAPKLPLFAYAALGWLDGHYWAAGIRVDGDPRQDPPIFADADIEQGVSARLKQDPQNRLLAHLGNCALVNRCAAAQNYFLGRFEIPLPSSPQCNADCVGCLSFQKPEAGFPSTQKRITFTPTTQEIASLAVAHLEKSSLPVASFGQGCEGEPLLQAPLLKESILAIRSATKRGVINLNTNGSRPREVLELAHAGLDAIRVSMNSAQEAWYSAYYHPRGYAFKDLKESLKAMVGAGRKASINYFVFPGVSDREREIEALLDLVGETGLHMIQWRNLNLDPELYVETLGGPEALIEAGEALGIPALLNELRQQFPALRFGYFNPAWGFEEALPGLQKEAGRAAQAWDLAHREAPDKLGTC
ncbi:MAG TPA: radical SAM protein [bacterium]|nr:radical SAM protein [bacterium]